MPGLVMLEKKRILFPGRVEVDGPGKETVAQWIVSSFSR